MGFTVAVAIRQRSLIAFDPTSPSSDEGGLLRNSVLRSTRHGASGDDGPAVARFNAVAPFNRA